MRRYIYGVSKEEVNKFVEENRVVRDWLSKYEEGTLRCNAQTLCRFFKWLRVKQDIHLSPEELLNEQITILRNRDSSVGDRSRHLRLVLDFCRDNPDFKGLSDGRKYGLFVTIKSFYEYHMVVLTTAKGVFGKRRLKNRRKQITLAEAKKIMGFLPQRERIILLIMLQSGMEIGVVLVKFNWMWPRIKPQLYSGASRVKVEFDERKGNSFPYFNYFSRDAIQELRKWLVHRQRILDHLRKKGKPILESVQEGQPIFITKLGTP